jgi:hypothetical protein
LFFIYAWGEGVLSLIGEIRAFSSGADVDRAALASSLSTLAAIDV